MKRVLGHVMSQTFNFHQMLFQFVLRCKGWAMGRAVLFWTKTEMSKSIVKGIGIGFLSCIGIGIAKTISQVLVLVLVLLRRQPKYWYWYC